MTVSSFNGYRRNDDYYRDVARGGVDGARPEPSYGKKVATGADSGVLWPNGAYYFPPATGASVSFVSDSIQDAAGGTGISRVAVHYLDSSLTEHSTVIDLTGTTAVVAALTDVRFIQCMHMVPGYIGTGGAAAGNIRAYNGTENYSYIAAGDRRCSSSVRMVPVGKRLLVTGMFGGGTSGTAAAGVTLEIATSHFQGYDFTTENLLMPQATGSFQDTSGGLSMLIPFPLTEGQAIGMIFKTDKAATITGSWFGVLENV